MMKFEMPNMQVVSYDVEEILTASPVEPSDTPSRPSWCRDLLEED